MAAKCSICKKFFLTGDAKQLSIDGTAVHQSCFVSAAHTGTSTTTTGSSTPSDTTSSVGAATTAISSTTAVGKAEMSECDKCHGKRGFYLEVVGSADVKFYPTSRTSFDAMVASGETKTFNCAGFQECTECS